MFIHPNDNTRCHDNRGGIDDINNFGDDNHNVNTEYHPHNWASDNNDDSCADIDIYIECHYNRTSDNNDDSSTNVDIHVECPHN